MNPAPILKLLKLLKPALSAALCLCLLACASTAVPPVQLFDLGQMPAGDAPGAAPAVRIPAVSLADIGASPALDSNYMLYRLQYENGQQLRSYAQHRWSMTPAQLLAQRFKTRVAAGGGVIVSAADGAANLPVLKIDLDDFSQLFSSVDSSVARISVRASVYRGRNLVAQHSFTQQADAGPNAPGGARAMAVASDVLIQNVMQWLQGLPLN